MPKLKTLFWSVVDINRWALVDKTGETFAEIDKDYQENYTPVIEFFIFDECISLHSAMNKVKEVFSKEAEYKIMPWDGINVNILN